MKKLRFLSFFFCAIAALAFTSCLNDDDDDNGLSPDEKQQCYVLTRGEHTGKLYYAKDPASTATNNNDSASVRWIINSDSTMVLQNIPSKAIASGITNNDELKKAIEDQPNVNISCYIGYYRTSPVQWLVNPITVTYNDVTYGGKSHKVQIAFYANNYYSFGSYNTTNGVMQMQIVVGGAYIDGTLDRNIMPRVFGLSFIQRK